ncbi:MAG: CusA/CzcA family heavy metal efflux RND transporter [Bacteroidota bacterium]
MLNKIIMFSVKQKLIIGLFVLGLIALGSYQFSKLPIDAVPDITNNQVQVITIVPSLGATDIERLITFPIEQANSNIPGLIEIRSFSRFGLSLVTIVFDDNTDVYWARQQVSERLQLVKEVIPTGVGIPTLAPVTTGLGEIYQYTVKAKKGYEEKFSLTDLRTIQDWMIRRQLLGVPGVADVSSFGGYLKQYEIAINPDKLKSYNITIADVFKALEQNNQNTGGAYIEKHSTVLSIRSEGLIGSIDDINNIAVKSTSNGTPLFIKDVAEVKIGHAIRYGALTRNGEGEVAGAVVMMLKGANSEIVIDKVKERIELIKQTLPEGVEIDAFLDRTKMVKNAIGTVETNLLEGALIVIFVLVLFLGNFRAGLLVASVIPLALLFAIIMMNLFGVSGNLMSLGALDFGLIVDGAVIIVEAVMHQLARKNTNQLNSSLQVYTDKEMDSLVTESSKKMMNSAVFGQIIILIVYLPIFSLQGIEGKMFKPMAQTVSFALLGAFILSLTYIPMMSALVLSKKMKLKMNFSDKLMAWIETRFEKLLSRILHFPKTVILISISLFIMAVFTLTNLGGEFIPSLEEGDFAVETRVLPGSNLNVSVDATSKSEKLLLAQFPEVIKVVSKIGSGEVPTDPMPIDASDMMVILKDKSEWTSAKTFDELAEKMTTALEAIPGVTFGFQYPVQMRFNELMTGAKQDVVCKIFGENLDTLTHYANKLAHIIETVDGAIGLYVEPVAGMPQIVITYNRANIAQYGLNIADINKIINTAFAGQSTGMVYEGEKRFDLVVRMNSAQRTDIADVQNLLIPTPNGAQIPLNQVADVQIKEGPNQIQREDTKRRIVVGFNVHNRDVESIVNELKEKVNAQVNLPDAYYVTYGGAFENLTAAKKRLSIAVPVSLLLIFLLLYFAFKSVKHGLLIYTAIPLSTIGGVFALAARGMPFSISAGIGFIALFGVAVLNGIVLIAEFNKLKQSGITNLKELVIQGTKLRLRPVLMTAFVASLGFFPMAFSNGAGAEVQRPLATVVIGGLLVASFLTLFVLPLLYILFENGLSSKNNKGMATTLSIILVLVLSTYSQQSQAQNTITLPAAIDSTLANNLQVKNERLKAEYSKKLVNSGASLPQTTLSGEFGQINSYYTDNKFSISQTLNFPTVYSKQKETLLQQWKSNVIAVNLKEIEIKKQVRLAYATYLYLVAKQKLLWHIDSLYTDFVSKATLKFKAGESNILELKTAENQRTQIAIQLQQLNSDMDIMLTQFQLLLNTKTSFIPANAPLKLSNNLLLDSSQVNNHPSIQLSMQYKQLLLAQTKFEKARLLPDISFAYNNMTMRGLGANDVLYDNTTRFQSAQIGLGIPLFYGAYKARIKAAKSNELIAENNLLLEKNTLQLQLKNAFTQYYSYIKIVDYYETSSLPGAISIIETANKQLSNGSISYIEWTMLSNQAVNIQSDYLSEVLKLNESIIYLQYLMNK